MTPGKGEGTDGLAAKAVGLLLFLGVGIYAVGVLGSHPSIETLGLVGGLHPFVWLGYLLMGGAVILAVVRLRTKPAYPILASLAILTALHGLPLLIEGTARFPFSYSVSGHVIYILQNGFLNPGLLPYQNWPGMMFLGSALLLVPGLEPDHVLALFYILVPWMLFFLSYGIAGALFHSAAKRWLAVWLFLLLNWVGQGYFIPSSVGLVLVASSLFVLIRLSQGASLPARPRQTAWVMANIVILAALVTTHFLTSLLMILTFLSIVAMRLLARNRASLPHAGTVLFGSMVLAWLMYFAGDFVLINLPKWVDQALTIGFITETSVGFAFSGSPDRLLLSGIKTFTLLLISVLALLGMLRFLRQGARMSGPAYLLLALVVGSFALVLLTPYGGEIVSRAYSYALLPLAMLACLGTLTRRQKTLLASVIIASFPLYVISAYGNEAFDYVAPSELPVAIFAVDRLDPDGPILISTPRTERLWNTYGIGVLRWFGDWETTCDALSATWSGTLFFAVFSQRDIVAFDYLTGGAIGMDLSLRSCTSQVYSNGIVDIGMRAA
ncbi:MAG: hypothetical protein V3W28_05475 [Thermoplasmata archaeon]